MKGMSMPTQSPPMLQKMPLISPIPLCLRRPRNSTRFTHTREITGI